MINPIWTTRIFLAESPIYSSGGGSPPPTMQNCRRDRGRSICKIRQKGTKIKIVLCNATQADHDLPGQLVLR